MLCSRCPAFHTVQWNIQKQSLSSTNVFFLWKWQRAQGKTRKKSCETFSVSLVVPCTVIIALCQKNKMNPNNYPTWEAEETTTVCLCVHVCVVDIWSKLKILVISCMTIEMLKKSFFFSILSNIVTILYLADFVDEIQTCFLTSL